MGNIFLIRNTGNITKLEIGVKLDSDSELNKHNNLILPILSISSRVYVNYMSIMTILAILKMFYYTMFSLTITLSVYTSCSLVALRFRQIAVNLNDLEMKKRHEYLKRQRKDILSKILNDQNEAFDIVKEMMDIFGLILTIHFTSESFNLTIITLRIFYVNLENGF